VTNVFLKIYFRLKYIVSTDQQALLLL